MLSGNLLCNLNCWLICSECALEVDRAVSTCYSGMAYYALAVPDIQSRLLALLTVLYSVSVGTRC